MITVIYDYCGNNKKPFCFELNSGARQKQISVRLVNLYVKLNTERPQCAKGIVLVM